MWIILFLLIGNSNITSSIDSFSWLQGTWEMKKKNGTSRLEIWSKQDDHTLMGRGLGVSGTDTTELESIDLVFQEGDFWYIPTVPDQNNAKPVKFKLVAQEELKFVFENPEHDFPQRIVYDYHPVTITGDLICQQGDTLSVKVEKIDGTNSVAFHFIRK